jgi:dUTP pyrophosphatase
MAAALPLRRARDAASQVLLPPTILKKLSCLQGALNAFIDREWVQHRSPNDWALAVQLEAGELIDSYPWKWWKNVKAQPNLANVKVELVDILHFTLSGSMQMLAQRAVAASEGLEVVEAAAKQRAALMQQLGLEATIRRPLDETANAVATFRGVMVLAHMHEFDLITEQVVAAAEDLGLNLVAFYVAKHTLNCIRQLGGYKDGTYVKVAAGKEDNELLHDVIAPFSVEEVTAEETHEGAWDRIMAGVYDAFKIASAERRTVADWVKQQ